MNGSPRMASPLAGLVAFVVAAILFAFGFLQLGTCGSNALFLFGPAIFFVGIGAAMFGGILVLYPTVFLAIILLIASLLTNRGVYGCWF